MALAIAGLPLTGGALAKLAIKDPLGDGTAAMLVTFSAVTTALLMLRFVWLEATADHHEAGTPSLGLLLPWAATVVAALGIPWVLFPVLTDHPAAFPFTLENLWAGLWPILLALAVAALALGLKLSAVTLPQGDIVVVAEAAARRIRRASAATAGAARTLRLPQVSSTLPGRLIVVIEQRSEQWTVVGPGLLVLALLIALTLL
jgi:hydrogenase-4 component B